MCPIWPSQFFNHRPLYLALTRHVLRFIREYMQPNFFSVSAPDIKSADGLQFVLIRKQTKISDFVYNLTLLL